MTGNGCNMNDNALSIVAISGIFPLAEFCLDKLMSITRRVIFRFDTRTCTPLYMEAMCNKYHPETTLYEDSWAPDKFREDLLRAIDTIPNKPKVVLCQDEDEVFDPCMEGDITTLINKGVDCGGMVSYGKPMPTEDGTLIFDGGSYPSAPHMLMFRWRPDLTYLPYQGYARVNNYTNIPYFIPKAKVWHYCCYTATLRATHNFKNNLVQNGKLMG